MRCYLSYAPPAYESGTRPFLRWVLSQGRSPTRQAVPKMPRTPSAFLFSERLRRQAINPTPPKRVKALGDGPLRPELLYPVVEHTQTNCAACNHSRSRVPHHWTQSNTAKNTLIFSSILGYSIIFSSIFGYFIIFSSILGCSIIFFSILGYSIIFSSILGYFIIFSSILGYSIIFSSILGHSIIFSSILGHSIIFSSIYGYFIIFSSILGHPITFS